MQLVIGIIGGCVPNFIKLRVLPRLSTPWFLGPEHESGPVLQTLNFSNIDSRENQEFINTFTSPRPFLPYLCDLEIKRELYFHDFFEETATSKSQDGVLVPFITTLVFC